MATGNSNQWTEDMDGVALESLIQDCINENDYTVHNQEQLKIQESTARDDSVKIEGKQPSGPIAKADREKARRCKLNQCYEELSQLCNSGKSPKRDKMAILCDSIKEIKKLKVENNQLSQLYKLLHDKIQSNEKDSYSKWRQVAHTQAGSSSQQQNAVPIQHIPALPNQIAAPQYQMYPNYGLTQQQQVNYPIQNAQATPSIDQVEFMTLQQLQDMQLQIQQVIQTKTIDVSTAPAIYAQTQAMASQQQQVAQSGWLDANLFDQQRDQMLRPPVA